MRIVSVLLASTFLAACGGAGVQSAGSSATASGSSTGASATPTAAHTFVAPTEVKTYSAIGGVHSYQYTTNDLDSDPLTAGTQSASQQYNQLYAGDATTARNSGITITYNPRDAIFDVVTKQPLAGVDNTLRFQDPVHRTDFGGARSPQAGVPNLSTQGVNYLQAGSASGTAALDPSQPGNFPTGNDGFRSSTSTFFYQKPGTTTSFVTFAGFVRNAINIASVTPVGSTTSYLEQNYTLERGAFVYGERTNSASVPRTGTGTFNGAMIATLVYNNLLDTDRGTPTYFQWLNGTSATTVDFAANTFSLSLNGTVATPFFDNYTSRVFTIQNGATFSATGAGRVDLVNAGGFLGNFSNVFFTQPDSTRLNLLIGGSSIDGTFFGPTAQEVGGGFRIVGGVPDERIDILGAFTGKR